MSSSAAAPIRLMNKIINPYWKMVDKNTPQSAVYVQGQELPPGLEGGFPTWVPCEFPAMAPFDTVDQMINVPPNFTVLALLMFTTDPAGAAFGVYDVEQELPLIDQLVDGRTLAGNGSGVLFLRVPYTFPSDIAEIFVRAVNQSANQNDVTLALYGVQGGAKD